MPPTRTKLKRKQIKLGAGTKSAVSMWFVHIPACPEGFLMGSRGYDAAEEPVHRVVIEDDFWMAETPVTQEQFDLWPGAATRGEEHWPDDAPKHPANNLSWNDAIDYCRWFTASFQKQFPTGFCTASLPTEANWEYGCRGSSESETEYHSGDGETALKVVGWYRMNSGERLHPVGTTKRLQAANAFGLYDMHGNIFELCLDRFDESAYQRRWHRITERETIELAEQFGDKSENPFRVMRGGCYSFTASACRAAGRTWIGESDPLDAVGFRICLFRSPLGETRTSEPERTASE